MLSDKRRREIAEAIIRSYVSDIEYLSVVEMTFDYADREGEKAEDDDYKIIDELVRSGATVTIVFDTQ